MLIGEPFSNQSRWAQNRLCDICNGQMAIAFVSKWKKARERNPETKDRCRSCSSKEMMERTEVRGKISTGHKNQALFKYYLVYKTTCLITKKYYIGAHGTDNLKDYYLGSGLYIKRALKKYGRENFKREILESLPDEETMFKREQELVEQVLGKDPLCMNFREGGFAPPNLRGIPLRPEHRKKISTKLKGNKNGIGNKNVHEYLLQQVPKDYISVTNIVRTFHCDIELLAKLPFLKIGKGHYICQTDYERLLKWYQ